MATVSVEVAELAHRVWVDHGGGLVESMQAAIEAALPHLESPWLTPPAAPRQCRICGCTDEEACPGGCSWSQPEICSTCAARQQVADAQYLATLRAQQEAGELQAKQAALSLDFVAEGRALIAEQTEVARMQREDLAGATWRAAVDCAARDAGSPTQTEGANHRIKDDAEWYAHLLGTPPVVF